MTAPKGNYPEITKRLDEITNQLDTITTRLDVTVSLLLDLLLVDEKFKEPGQLVEKLKILDSSRRFPLRPAEIGRILGRPSRDISSRRKEIMTLKKRKTRQKEI